MIRKTLKNGVRAATFSHWSHRTRYTCRACHLELGFEVKVNATEIAEEKKNNGDYYEALVLTRRMWKSARPALFGACGSDSHVYLTYFITL
jgi:hypothetical protein